MSWSRARVVELMRDAEAKPQRLSSNETLFCRDMRGRLMLEDTSLITSNQITILSRIEQKVYAT